MVRRMKADVYDEKWVRTMRRITATVALVLGVLLIAGAGVVRWVVAPSMIVLPSDTNTTRVYAGTASAVMNPTLLTGTLFGPALLRNQPAEVRHTDRVLSTSGSNALVADSRVVTIPGFTVANLTARYAVDRKTMSRGSGFTGAISPSGVSFNWPIDTKKHNYLGWVPDTHTTTTLVYRGTATRGGISTYVFKATVTPQRIIDSQLLAALPASMTKSMLTSSAATLGLTSTQLQQMATLTPQLPDPVPLVYTFAATSTYWVAPDSGVVVDVQSHEVRAVNLEVGGALVPIAPVLDLSYASPASTLQAAVNDAKDKAAQMTLIRSTLPAILGGVGIVLAFIGAGLLAFRRHPVVPPAPQELEQISPTEVGTSR